MPTVRDHNSVLKSLGKTAANVLDVLSYKHNVQSVCWPLSCIPRGSIAILNLLHNCKGCQDWPEHRSCWNKPVRLARSPDELHGGRLHKHRGLRLDPAALRLLQAFSSASL